MKSTELLRHVEQRIGSLDASILEALSGRSMLLTQDWSRQELELLVAAAGICETLDHAGIPTPLFPQELHYALFFDSSTRTKSSWAGAAARLGAVPIVVDGATTQVSHGETPQETGAMLGMNAHALGIRHDLILGAGNRFMREAKAGIDGYLAATERRGVVPIVNLQCDVDHPTQTLADLIWLTERFPNGLAGKTIAVSWAYSPTYAKPLSVPQGLIMLLTRFGMHVRLAYPKGYDLMPEPLEFAAKNAASAGGSFTPMSDMDQAFKNADVVYPKSWGPYDLMLERVAAHGARDERRMHEIEMSALARNRDNTDWICNATRMAQTRDGGALYMHCLPADIGGEVTADVLERFRLDLAREAQKKLYVIMALLAISKEPQLKERWTGFLP